MGDLVVPEVEVAFEVAWLCACVMKGIWDSGSADEGAEPRRVDQKSDVDGCLSLLLLLLEWKFNGRKKRWSLARLYSNGYIAGSRQGT